MKSLSLFVLLFAATAHASNLADDLVGELYTMKSVYSAEYAPANWKKTYAGYDLDTQFNTALAAVQANPNLTPRDAREILKTFIYAMKDYHTSISFVATEQATLPLSIKGTDTQYFIMFIDRTKLTEAAFPFHVGDELVTFDGKPTAQAIAEVQAVIPANVPSTDKALAELYLTKRRASRGYDVPKGPVTLGIKAAGSHDVSEIQLAWDYTPEQVTPRGPLNNAHSAHAVSSIFHPRMSVDADAPANPYDLGERQTFTPDLGVKVWQSQDSDFYYAYIYKAAGGKLVAYLRLASFEAPDFGKAVAEFARDMALFDATADDLVIDEANNPGGSVFYMYALGSMLTTKPMTTPLHRMAINQADVLAAQTAIGQLATVADDASAQKIITPDQTDGYPVSYEFAQFQLNYSQFIVSEWNAGRKLTNPYWIAGVDHINPAAVHFSKPILFLINNLDFSGGDFFPATLQDNKRVTIMGSRTAGAGGYVADVNVPNNVGVNAFRCTESIAERVDQNPIENLGVTPDINYTMTADDFAGNYAKYVAAIQAAVAGL